ncbi:uncharacterized protein HGUI_02101 [Hanseniaspora guilliermondii]|uniref:Pre-mRNA polyadenylation factor Fip1 domain-containing protein n=1 Tax=Hanseniaspora guilliermondii TaxID=56406 RepID=A0A1L0CM05_9ASCO|nr:uncharacterized protein HGUI_02101 [Hanseniaspora guilliermondii]
MSESNNKRALDLDDLNDDDLYNENNNNKKMKIEETQPKQESESEYTEESESDDDIIFNFGNNSKTLSSNKTTKSNDTNITKPLDSDSASIKSSTEANEEKPTIADKSEVTTDVDDYEEGEDEEIQPNFLIEDENIPFFITSTDNKPIDVNKDDDFEGVDLKEIEPSFMKEKPWRSSRAKIEHYFNYGFNEATWTEYLSKHTKYNVKYSGSKLLYQLLLLQSQNRLDTYNNINKNNYQSVNSDNVKSNPQQQMTVPEVAKLKNLLKYQQKQQLREPPLPIIQPIINAQGNIINPNAINNSNNTSTMPPGMDMNMPTGNMFPFPPFNMMNMGNNNNLNKHKPRK